MKKTITDTVLQLQAMARPGGGYGFGSYNTSATFTVIFYLSLGVTSRGRIGINSDMRGIPLVQPWFQDTNDKTAMVTGITQALANITTNGRALYLREINITK